MMVLGKKGQNQRFFSVTVLLKLLAAAPQSGDAHRFEAGGGFL